MTSRDFCYWLQGYFEINASYAEGSSQPSFTATQIECVKKHLAMVFLHEIDPSFPADEQAKLTEAHDSLKKAVATFVDQGKSTDGKTVYRC